MTTAPGPLAEEAARLVEALSDWARGHAGDLPGAVAGQSAQIGGSAECRICPLCQAIALMRQARPETFVHLLEASTAFTAALRTLVDSPGHRHTPGRGVERIDLDDDAGMSS
ncbi:MAG: DUF5304 family protein [Frankiales bacterium]|nr:DUF5304 family protein [Frankiales bacterium]